ncbi:MAG: DUF4160 domain-containing protein [Comamonadaceae bacterium]|nr:DUF4160 domain-containing protein [Comamonadaceae bacterium]
MPHIHAKHAEFEASIEIGDGEILSGNPRKQLQVVRRDRAGHRDELVARLGKLPSVAESVQN